MAETLREIQERLPWIDSYSAAFKANPAPHRDFDHALKHVVKAAGKLTIMVEDADHKGAEGCFPSADVSKYLADVVICALRMANVTPGGVIDLQQAVLDRITVKNGTSI